MNIRFFALLAAVTLLNCGTAVQLLAQQLKLQVDRQSGNLSLTGVDSSNVDFAFYDIRSARGTLDVSSWNGMRDTELNWDVFGVTSPPGPNYLAEGYVGNDQTGGAVVNNSSSFDLGNAYDPSTAAAGLSFGEDVELNDLSFVYVDQMQDAIDLPGVVEFVGEKIYNNIGITVDLANGRAYIENESTNDLTTTGYTIKSGSGLLNVGAGYTGLGGGFQIGPDNPDGTGLGEIDSTGTGQLLASSTATATLGIDLGVVVDPASLFLANGDLTFRFNLGSGSRDGFVKYINIPTLPGDFNGDLVVNAADYTVWRNNLGAPTDDALNGAGDGHPGIDAGDYTLWKNSFGTGSGAASLVASSQTVPEPSSIWVFAIALLGTDWSLLRAGRRSKVGQISTHA
jgi:hypothetical protein